MPTQKQIQSRFSRFHPKVRGYLDAYFNLGEKEDSPYYRSVYKKPYKKSYKKSYALSKFISNHKKRFGNTGYKKAYSRTLNREEKRMWSFF